VACVRHGVLRRNSLANLYKGEQQKNADWALMKAVEMARIKYLPRLIVMYDIACQYYPRLREWIGHIFEGHNIVLDRAVGKFHLYGHIEQCFARFASVFVPGAWAVSGEILESIWSVLNKIGHAVRTASLEHRAELLDDHMNDSNWKKLLGMYKSMVLLSLHLPTVLQASTCYPSLNDRRKCFPKHAKHSQNWMLKQHLSSITSGQLSFSTLLIQGSKTLA